MRTPYDMIPESRVRTEAGTTTSPTTTDPTRDPWFVSVAVWVCANAEPFRFIAPGACADPVYRTYTVRLGKLMKAVSSSIFAGERGRGAEDDVSRVEAVLRALGWTRGRNSRGDLAGGLVEDLDPPIEEVVYWGRFRDERFDGDDGTRIRFLARVLFDPDGDIEYSAAPGPLLDIYRYRATRILSVLDLCDPLASEALAVLARVEWVRGDDGGWECPSCGRDGSRGHHDSCSLASVLHRAVVRRAGSR